MGQHACLEERRLLNFCLLQPPPEEPKRSPLDTNIYDNPPPLIQTLFGQDSKANSSSEQSDDSPKNKPALLAGTLLLVLVFLLTSGAVNFGPSGKGQQVGFFMPGSTCWCVHLSLPPPDQGSPDPSQARAVGGHLTLPHLDWACICDMPASPMPQQGQQKLFSLVICCACPSCLSSCAA